MNSLRTGYGKANERYARIVFAMWSLMDKRGLSKEAAEKWAGLRFGNEPGPDTRTTAQRLADRRYNPFEVEA